MKDVISNLVTTVKLKAEERNVEVALKLDADIPKTLNGDPLRLEQVLINLVSNAIKFSHPHDFVTIKAQLKGTERGKVIVHFSITDNGIGISKENQIKLFKPFSQADSSTTRNYGGTGLGLVISKQIVELMNGNIWVDSDEGKGSAFHFIVELKNQSNEELPETAQGSSKDGATEDIEALRGSTVLLVEDNQLNQELVKELMEIHGVLIETAYNGEEALELLEKHSFDCVLMDCQMPVMDGLEATKRIRKKDKYKDLPIIAVTANVMKSDIDEILAVGMNDLISKPIDPDIMFVTMSKWIKSS